MQIILEGLSCVITPESKKSQQSALDSAIQAGYKQIYIIQPGGGILVHHALRPGRDGKARYVQLPVDKIPGFESKEYKPEVRFLPDGKIPIRLLDEIKAFFHEVIVKKGRALEAMVWILWNPERGYFLHVPNQIVSHASAQYDWSGLPADSSIIVDIHSHADFGAFFSSTDDRDDASTIRFSGVLGHNNTPSPSSKFRFNYLGKKIDVEIRDLFSERPADPVEVPSEWLDKVQLVSTAPKKHEIRSGMDGSSRWVYSSGMSGQYISKSEQNRLGSHYHGAVEDVDAEYPWQVTSEKQLSNKEKRRVARELLKKGEMAGNNPEQHSLDLNVTPAEGPFQQAERILHSGSLPKTSPASKPGVADEDALSDAADAYLDKLVRALEAGEPLPDDPTEEVPEDASAKTGGFTVTISDADIPTDYDVVACNHGVEAAKAYAMIDYAATSLIGNGPLLGNSVTELFNLVEEDEKLAVFRKLYETLPKSAIHSIATNGMN